MTTASTSAIATRIGNSRQNDRFLPLRLVLVPVPAGPTLAAAAWLASVALPADDAPVSGSAAGPSAVPGSCGVACADASAPDSAPGVGPRPAPLIRGPSAPARRGSPVLGSRLPDQDSSPRPTSLVDPLRCSFELSAIA